MPRAERHPHACPLPRAAARVAAGAVACLAVACAAAVATAAGGIDGAALARRHGFAPGDVGFVLFDATSGEVLDEHGADEPFIPASTTKVATALAALEVLGTDYRFATTLLGTGEIRGGTLTGDLYLRGGGDPTLTSDDLRALARALRGRGVSRVDGAFYFDETLFPRSSEIDLLQPEAASYNPAVSALSVNYNRILLRWQRKSGGLATTLLSPADGGAVAVPGIGTGTLGAGAEPDVPVAFAAGPPPRWLVSPRLPAKGTVALPLKPDPGRVAAGMFAALARAAGVALPEPRRGTAPPGARELARHESPPLAEIAQGLLRYSNNLTAELVGLATSRRLTGEGLALAPSAERVARWWRDRLAAAPFDTFVATNHSGLSSRTRHSPRQLAAVLRHGYATPLAGPRLRDLLAPWRDDGDGGAGGTTGGPDARVRAKSGTLLYGDGLVGYLPGRGGRVLGFAILLSDLDARARLDATRDVAVAASPPDATAWTSRAKALERELVRRWRAAPR